MLLCSSPGQHVSHQTENPVTHTRWLPDVRFQLQDCGPASARRQAAGGWVPLRHGTAQCWRRDDPSPIIKGPDTRGPDLSGQLPSAAPLLALLFLLASCSHHSTHVLSVSVSPLPQSILICVSWITHSAVGNQLPLCVPSTSQYPSDAFT